MYSVRYLAVHMVETRVYIQLIHRTWVDARSLLFLFFSDLCGDNSKWPVINERKSILKMKTLFFHCSTELDTGKFHCFPRLTAIWLMVGLLYGMEWPGCSKSRWPRSAWYKVFDLELYNSPRNKVWWRGWDALNSANKTLYHEVSSKHQDIFRIEKNPRRCNFKHTKQCKHLPVCV